LNIKKAATYIGGAFVVFYVLSSPKDAGAVARSAFAGIESAGNQVATFVTSIVPDSGGTAKPAPHPAPHSTTHPTSHRP
jgi:hypothetical protein